MSVARGFRSRSSVINLERSSKALDGFGSMQPPAMLMTVRDVAELLRTSAKAIYAMVERGQLPGVRRIGRRVLFKRDDLLHWLDHNCMPSLKE